MVKVIVLGSANAIPTAEHENTFMLIQGNRDQILVDCPVNPIVRFRQANIDPKRITGVLVTHFHPDHVAGLPGLFSTLWLLGRRQPLKVYGYQFTLDRVEQMIDLFDFDTWPEFFPIEYCSYPEENLTQVIDTPEFRIVSSPGVHIIPTSGLRIEAHQTGKVLAYSSDTEPCEAIIELAAEADILIHEASGSYRFHSSAAQAGGVAQKAKAKTLYFVHYTPDLYNSPDMLAAARQHFSGDIQFASDLLEIEF
jgi:ribonuclease Z